MTDDGPMPGTAAVRDEDRELVTQAQAGSRSAFNRLVIAHQHQIMTLCCRMLSRRDEAEEAAQDTFVRAWQSIGRFKGEARFSTWVYRIAVNTCRNRRRSWWWKVRRRSVQVEQPEDPETDTPRRELGDTRMSPEKDLVAKRTRAAFRKALEGLPHIHRELIVLRDLKDMPYEEISSGSAALRPSLLTWGKISSQLSPHLSSSQSG